MTLPTARETHGATRLVIPAITLVGHTGHWFNELLHFKNESADLGLTPRIIVPRSTEERVAAELEADRILDPLPGFEVNAENFFQAAIAFADTDRFFTPLRDWLDAECLDCSDIIYFPQGHPILIRGIARWLSQLPDGKRPAVFFRIIGFELTDLDTGRFKPRAAFYRLASADLEKAPGQERVFFLVNSSAKARSVSRVLRRRPFMMQHHFGRSPDIAPASDPVGPTIYIHLNARSGRCLSNLREIIKRVCASEPTVRFLLKPVGDMREAMAAVHLEDISRVEILPSEMNSADYFVNLARSTLVVLAYEAQPYRFLTSGVFTEAASLGRPVIVPEGTWMAEKIAQGYGVGMLFADPSVQSMTDVILRSLRDSRQLASDAKALAPRLAEETGCRRFIETMVTLSKTTPDMEPAYQIGEQIDFGDALDSGDFLGNGWGELEPWGIWTVGNRAELSLRIDAKPDAPLFLNALALMHLPPRRDGEVKVRVCCRTSQIAEWKFSSADPNVNQARWFSAPLPASGQLDGILEISFEIEGATSPFAEGLGPDRRTLGLGLIKLSITRDEPAHVPPSNPSSSRWRRLERQKARLLAWMGDRTRDRIN